MEASVKLEASSSLAPHWTMAVKGLIRGAGDSASLLGALLQDQSPGSATRVLTEEIASSISRALLIFDDCEKMAVARTVSSRSPCSSGKKKITPVRRIYKSRSCPDSCTRITTKTMEDAYNWRKYGQKPIYNATFPRNYYRCTHKNNRGCQATRQVQQLEEDPTMLVITYMGEHTCISDPPKTSTSGSYLICFESETSISLPFPNPETDEEVMRSGRPMDSPLSEGLLLPEGLTFEMSAPSPSTSPSLPSATSSSVIAFDIPRDCLELDFMGDNEFINLDELLNFNNDDRFLISH